MPTVLFLGANGRDTTRLRLGAEAREIRRELQAIGTGESFRIATELAVRPNDLQNLLLVHAPRSFQTPHGLTVYLCHTGLTTGAEQLCPADTVRKFEANHKELDN